MFDDAVDDEDTTAIDSEDPDAGDDADSEDTGTDDDTDSSSADDDTSDGDDTGDIEEDVAIPKSRFDEVNNRMKKAEEAVEDLTQQIDYITQLRKQGDEDKADDIVEDLKRQGFDGDQIDAIAKLVDKGGSKAAKQVEELRNELAAEKDRNSRKEAISKFNKKGINITEEEIVDQMRAWKKAGDPKFNIDYDDMIYLIKRKEIAEKEVDSSISKKKKTSAKVEKSTSSGKKSPDEKRFVFDPEHPNESMEALEREVMERLIEEDEN